MSDGKLRSWRRPVTLTVPPPRPHATAKLGGEAEYEWTPPASSSVAVVLNEFVRSDYARQIFSYMRAPGTDYGQIRAMFESVRLTRGTLEIIMREQYNNHEGLLDRLPKYLRARIPQLKGVHQILRDGRAIL